MTIKPCPMCGKPPKTEHGEMYFFIRCDSIHKDGPVLKILARNEAEAVRAWNSLSEPTDRRCGTCAAFTETDINHVGLCDALAMFADDHRHFLSADKNGHQCALWRLRGAE